MPAGNKRSKIRRKRLKSYDREEILSYLRQLAASLGKETLTAREINKYGEINQATINRKFGGLSQALIEAGLKPTRIYKRDPRRMIDELASLMQSLGREPKKTEINKSLSYNSRHYELEFGTLERAFDLAQEHAELLPKKDSDDISIISTRLRKSKRKRRRYGKAIQFRSLRHAPINELGVVFLFGMLSEELGFEVESIQSGFPDCDAKLKLSDGTFERVRIEFEYKSSDFHRHMHDPSECDILVCWKHDWSDCPSEIEIIELKSIIGKLNS